MLATSEATATNPIQSPIDDTSIARHRRENDGWVRRSLKLAGLVPLSAAISSATLAMGSHRPRGPMRIALTGSSSLAGHSA